MNNRHKAEVIEVYDDGRIAAVKFYCSVKRGERIECVNYRGKNPPFFVGQRGMVDYVKSTSGYLWVFEPLV